MNQEQRLRAKQLFKDIVLQSAKLDEIQMQLEDFVEECERIQGDFQDLGMEVASDHDELPGQDSKKAMRLLEESDALISAGDDIVDLVNIVIDLKNASFSAVMTRMTDDLHFPSPSSQP